MKMSTLDRTVAPPTALLPVTPLPEPRRLTLGNGLALDILDDTATPGVCRLTLLRSGGLAEAPSPEAATLAMAAMAEGAGSHGPDELADLLDSGGASLSGNADTHHCRLTCSMLSAKATEVAPLVAEVATAPAFPQSAVEAVAEALASGMEVEQGREKWRASRAVAEAVRGVRHPLSRVQSPEAMREAAAEGLHIRCQSEASPWSRAWLSGRVTADAERAVIRALEALPPVGAGGGGQLRVEPYAGSRGLQVEIACPGALQSAVCWGLEAIPRSHPDYAALHIAVYALGGYFGSRLMARVREEQGLTYGITAVLIGQREGSEVRIAAETSGANVGELLDEVRRQLELLATQPLPPDELERMRRNYLTECVSALDTPFRATDFLIGGVTTGYSPALFEQKQRAALAVTPAEICRVAGLYLDPRALNIAVAGA